MIRLFNTHKIRNIVELEGTWDFATIEESSSTNEYIYTHKIAVPSCWESYNDFLTYRGKGVYRLYVEVSRPGAVRLVFKGVSHTADIYFDGKKIAHHYEAFTIFNAIVSNVIEGRHELVVVADNSFNELSAVHIPNDYYTYGGIIRPVVLENISDIFIDKIHFTPSYSDNKWKANLKVYIKNISINSKSINVNLKFDGEALDCLSYNIPSNSEIIVEKTYDFEGVEAWCHENPKLYFIEAQLLEEGNRAFDDFIERVAFRTSEAKDGKILINGNAVFLKGFNRHEDHPTVGSSFPYQLMVKDLELIIASGANAVRTSHYPNDERFLDLCDENGIYIWEENHARGLQLEQMKNPHFEQQCEDCIREMIDQHYNHPSIIIWGILNECASHTAEGRIMYKKQFDQIATLDKTRPTTSASCQHYTDICLDLPEVVSINLYPGWYEEISAAEKYDGIQNWIDEAGGAGKPIIVSEFGGDGFYGYRDPSRVRGTEERQCDIIEDNLSAYYARDRVAGVFIWQFCDCRVYDGGNWFVTRGRNKNNKGIVDEYRRPKLAYDIVKKFFGSKMR